MSVQTYLITFTESERVLRYTVQQTINKSVSLSWPTWNTCYKESLLNQLNSVSDLMWNLVPISPCRTYWCCSETENSTSQRFILLDISVNFGNNCGVNKKVKSEVWPSGCSPLSGQKIHKVPKMFRKHVQFTYETHLNPENSPSDYYFWNIWTIHHSAVMWIIISLQRVWWGKQGTDEHPQIQKTTEGGKNT